MTTTPLTVLDLVPISSGSNATQALRNSIDLAQQTERLGYARYWFAEHHLNPGVAGTSPAVVLALTAAATSTIRLGSGAVQMGHRTALSTVEEFGLLDALHPGRFDLGPGPLRRPAARADGTRAGRRRRPRRPVVDGRTPNGLLIPPRFSSGRCSARPGSRCRRTLLQLPHARAAELHRAGRRRPRPDRRHLPLAGRRRGPRGARRGRGRCRSGSWAAAAARAPRWPARNGLRFAANYHVSPATVLEAVEGYRAAFRPSAELGRPYVSVSADVVVADDEATARELATGYGLWVRSIRTGRGRHPVPDPRARPARHAGATPTARWSPTASTPSSSAPRGQVADQLETPARRHRRRRADRHHHHPRPRRPRPLLRAARRGMGPALTRRPACATDPACTVLVTGSGWLMAAQEPRRYASRNSVNVTFGQMVPIAACWPAGGQRGVTTAEEDERGGRGSAGLDVPHAADHDLVVAAGQAVLHRALHDGEHAF